MELQNIINESWDIRGNVISVDNFSTRSSPHCAVVVNAHSLLFFTSSYEIYLAVYDSTDNKLSKKLLIKKIDNISIRKNIDLKCREIKKQLTNSGEINNNFCYKNLIIDFSRNFTISSQDNLEDYLRPFDIVKRRIIEKKVWDRIIPKWHYAIYLGGRKVCHISGYNYPVKIDEWEIFLDNQKEVQCYHPLILFKDNLLIIDQLQKCLESNYGQNTFNPSTRNCEHFTNLIVYGLHYSEQTDTWLDILRYLHLILLSFSIISVIPSIIYHRITGEDISDKKVELEKNFFDNLEEKRRLTSEEQTVLDELKTQILIKSSFNS